MAVIFAQLPNAVSKGQMAPSAVPQNGRLVPLAHKRTTKCATYRAAQGEKAQLRRKTAARLKIFFSPIRSAVGVKSAGKKIEISGLSGRFKGSSLQTNTTKQDTA